MNTTSPKFSTTSWTTWIHKWEHLLKYISPELFTTMNTCGWTFKLRFCHHFWLRGPIDLRSTRLNCILQDLFKDTLLDHIWPAKICVKHAYFAQYANFRLVALRHLWVCKFEIWHEAWFCPTERPCRTLRLKLENFFLKQPIEYL